MRLQGAASSKSHSFKPESLLPLVPLFHEPEVTKFFTAFELAAKRLEWQECHWPTLIHCCLTGKALTTFNRLTEEDLKSFQVVRDSMLKVYKLVPETYRQQFRNTVMQQRQSFGEFSRRKEDLFNKWIGGSGVKTFLELRN